MISAAARNADIDRNKCFIRLFSLYHIPTFYNTNRAIKAFRFSFNLFVIGMSIPADSVAYNPAENL
jgi:hypothetical protein